VICDNCTDETAAIAARHGAFVFNTVGNKAKKAGALNQALTRMLPSLRGDDLVLVMDADSAGTLFRVSALREVARERGYRLPGTRGEFYSRTSITEDDEITLALKARRGLVRHEPARRPLPPGLAPGGQPGRPRDVPQRSEGMVLTARPAAKPSSIFPPPRRRPTSMPAPFIGPFR
jgi:hypothetical protein